MKYLEKQSPARIIAIGFLAVILTGFSLLMLPVCVKPGVRLHYVDALFTSTSAVCVTGLIAVDTADTYTALGQTVVALLIQIGGLGVTSVGVGVILALGKRVNLKERLLVKEALNLDSGRGIVCLVRNVLMTTLCFEGVGAVLSFLVFSRDYLPLEALGISLFHSVAAFNNSGFDILGGLKNLTGYQDNVLLNLTTAGLIIFGGLGFLVIMDLIKNRSFKKLCLHSKAVIVTTLILLVSGTVLIRLTEDITWLGAFFTSVSARTAGFSTFPLGEFTSAGLLTLFTLFHTIKGAACNEEPHAFHYRIPQEAFYKAAIVTALSALVVCLGTFFMCILEPAVPFEDILFEITSAFGIVGLSTGITPGLSSLSKLLEVLVMYIGRLGPLTIVTIWVFKPTKSVSYAEGSISIG